MYLRHCKVLTRKTHQRRGGREGRRDGGEGGGCGGVHALKCRHVANMSHFAISVPDMSARMNDVGQRGGEGVFVLKGQAEPLTSV